VAEGAGDLDQESVAFDQADRAAVVDDGNDEGVRLTVKRAKTSLASTSGAMGSARSVRTSIVGILAGTPFYAVDNGRKPFSEGLSAGIFSL
jgi:hypothetical protein